MTTALLLQRYSKTMINHIFALVDFDEEGYPIEKDVWEKDEFDDDMDDEDENEDPLDDEEDETQWE